jgi:predicted alpha/beta-hydrolase family hydrolase
MTANETVVKVRVKGAADVTLVRTSPAGEAWMRFLYAPGAGSGIDDGFGRDCAARLPAEGVDCWRFQFPYREAGRRAPDRPPVLEATWRAVIDAATVDGVPLVVGGRSMGGRIASQVVAAGTPVAGLALFAYPLHSPGKPEQRRDAHLASIAVPTLFCSGTRDTFASPEELKEASTLVEASSLHLLEGADHGFSTLKASGRSREDVWAEAVEALFAFLRPLAGR